MLPGDPTMASSLPGRVQGKLNPLKGRMALATRQKMSLALLHSRQPEEAKPPQLHSHCSHLQPKR